MFDCIAITNRHLCPGDFLTQIEKLAKSGRYRILLREKDLPYHEYEALAKEVLGICRTYQADCIFHFYPEAAENLGCMKLHLPLPSLRQQPGLSERFTVGASIHSIEEAQEAYRLGASYLTAGHIFKTDCKKGLLPRGLIFLKKVCESVPIPIYAIGGISRENAGQAVSAGAAGICLMSTLMREEDPAEYFN